MSLKSFSGDNCQVLAKWQKSIERDLSVAINGAKYPRRRNLKARLGENLSLKDLCPPDWSFVFHCTCIAHVADIPCLEFL